jgi:hypothetical protein
MFKLYYCAAAVLLGAIIGATAPPSWQGGKIIAAQTGASAR